MGTTGIFIHGGKERQPNDSGRSGFKPNGRVRILVKILLYILVGSDCLKRMVTKNVLRYNENVRN